MAVSPPAVQRIAARFLLQHGSTQGSERILSDYTEAASVTGNQAVVFNKEIAGGASNTSIDLSQYVDTLTWFSVTDRGNKGFKISLANTGAKFQVAANGTFVFKNGASTPPTIYIDAVDATDATFLEIALAGSSA